MITVAHTDALVSNTTLLLKRLLYGDENVSVSDLYMISLILWLKDQQEWYSLDEDKRKGLEVLLDSIFMKNSSLRVPVLSDQLAHQDVNIRDMYQIKQRPYDIDGSIAPTTMYMFFGLLEGYTGVADIDYDVLVTTLSGTILTKPKSTYNHGANPAYGVSNVIAFPSAWGRIMGVEDMNGKSLTGAYEWVEKMIHIPNVGPVLYTIGGAKKKMIYNDSTVVVWVVE